MLKNSEIVHLNCNHDVHQDCLINRLDKGETLLEKEIDFGFLKCPICDSIFDCPSKPEIQEKIDKHKKLFSQIAKMKEQRIIYYKMKPEASSSFLFLLCNKCHQPYYAGKKIKRNIDINHDEDNGADNNLIIFEENKKSCLCGKDSLVYDAKGFSKCFKHGFQFTEYKCKFCCNIASRFCSQTHYCEECYAKRNNNNESICGIKECDKDTCEFDGIHAPNGCEYCLGCFICRYESFKG